MRNVKAVTIDVAGGNSFDDKLVYNIKESSSIRIESW